MNDSTQCRLLRAKGQEGCPHQTKGHLVDGFPVVDLYLRHLQYVKSECEFHFIQLLEYILNTPATPSPKKDTDYKHTLNQDNTFREFSSRQFEVGAREL